MTTQDQAGPIIRVHVTPTLADFLFCQRRMIGKQFASRATRWLCTPLILGAICMLFVPMGDDADLGVRLPFVLGFLPIPALVFVLMPLLYSYAIRRLWRTAPEMSEPVTYIFSESGVQTIGQTYSTTVSWSSIGTAERISSIIFLGTGQRLFYVVPVKAFESEADFEGFCNLVEKNVAKCNL